MNAGFASPKSDEDKEVRADMKYVNAKAVLPYHLVEELQKITGRIYLYPGQGIPAQGLG